MLKPTDSLHHIYLHTSTLLTVGAGASIILLLVSMYLIYPGGYPDPFIPYGAMNPGQPTSVLSDFACRVEIPQWTPNIYDCLIHPGDELIFSRIQVLTANGIVKQITFFGKSLQVVDLIRHFGKPSSVSLYNQHHVLNWDNGIHAITPINERSFTHQLRVMFVTLSLQNSRR